MRYSKYFISNLFKLVPSNIPFPIVRGPLRGQKWLSGAAAGEGKGLSEVLNLSEKNQAKQASDFTNSRSVCYDIGANVGFYTLLFARHAKHVYAFEPYLPNIQKLKKTLSVNKVSNATIVPVAISNKLGTLKFQIGKNNALGKLNPTGNLTVKSTSIDSFVIDHEAPSIIKIDVEGAELEALQGAEKTLKDFFPTILVSTHSEKLKEKCLEFLFLHGYVVYSIIGDDSPALLAVSNLFRAKVSSLDKKPPYVSSHGETFGS